MVLIVVVVQESLSAMSLGLGGSLLLLFLCLFFVLALLFLVSVCVCVCVLLFPKVVPNLVSNDLTSVIMWSILLSCSMSLLSMSGSLMLWVGGKVDRFPGEREGGGGKAG